MSTTVVAILSFVAGVGFGAGLAVMVAVALFVRVWKQHLAEQKQEPKQGAGSMPKPSPFSH